MFILSKEIEKHIKKLVNPLKDEDELLASLKVRLTKKELKLLKYWAEGIDVSEVQKELTIDEKRYDELSAKLIKKLNQEKTKQEICIR